VAGSPRVYCSADGFVRDDSHLLKILKFCCLELLITVLNSCISILRIVNRLKELFEASRVKTRRMLRIRVSLLRVH